MNMPNEKREWWEDHCLTAYMYGVPASSIPPLLSESTRRAIAEERARVRGVVEENQKLRTPEQEENLKRFGDGQTYAQGYFNGFNDALSDILSRINE